MKLSVRDTTWNTHAWINWSIICISAPIFGFKFHRTVEYERLRHRSDRTSPCRDIAHEIRTREEHFSSVDSTGRIPLIKRLVKIFRLPKHTCHFRDFFNVPSVDVYIKVFREWKHAFHVLDVWSVPHPNVLIEGLRVVKHISSICNARDIPVWNISVELFIIRKSSAHISHPGNIPVWDFSVFSLRTRSYLVVSPQAGWNGVVKRCIS